jgi:hypothetical protein
MIRYFLERLTEAIIFGKFHDNFMYGLYTLDTQTNFIHKHIKNTEYKEYT